MTVFQKLGDPHCQAECLRQLGETLHALGRTAQARACWRDALKIFERLQITDDEQIGTLLNETPSDRM